MINSSSDDPAVRRITVTDPAIAEPVRASLRKKCFVLMAFSVTMLLTGKTVAAPQASPPDFPTIAHAIESWFAAQEDYQPGDIITRAQVEIVLKKLDDAGVHVPDARAITELALANDSFMVRELTTANGRKFMRKLARNPGTFGRLDRLSALPRGEKIISDLVREKDGDKMIEYLATTKGGQKMGGMMAGVSGGADLNKPTGRIYTLSDFETALQQSLVNAKP
jgi:hypothetical protein